MADEVIDRVDELIRKNNIKYKDEMSQKAYEQALKQYEKQSKVELTKQYAQIVKEGNRKAIEKAKEIRNLSKKSKKKRTHDVVHQQKEQKKDKTEQKYQQGRPKLSENQIAMFNRTVEARAQRILQEQQLQKLNKRLDEEKKRTKLYELNQKCKKMLSKSHQRIVPARNVSESKMAILKSMEEKAFGEIKELDNIINNLVDRANEAKRGTKPHPVKSLTNTQVIRELPQHHLHDYQQNHEDQVSIQPKNQEFEVYADSDDERDDSAHFNNLLNINTLLFQKSTDELLKMNYIPI